jgi:hypothetical protein
MSKFLSPVEGSEMFLYSPDISIALFHDFLYNRKKHSGWRGPETLLIMTAEFEVDLGTS